MLDSPLVLDAQDLDDLARGAMLLGAGGGGASMPAAGLSLAVETTSLDDLPDTARVCAVAQIGAPMVGLERLRADEMSAAVRLLAAHVRHDFDALLALEIGGQNALVALFAAVELGLPLIDGDAMGRAFAGIHQTTLALAGLHPSPLALASPSGEAMILHSPDSEGCEVLARRTLPALGGRAAFAGYPVTARALRGTIVEGSLSRIRAMGTVLGSGDDGALEALGARRLFSGVVADVEHQGQRTVISALDRRGEHVARLDAGTEFERLIVDGRLVAEGPDVIAVLDPSEQPLLIESIVPSRTVAVLSFPADAAWQSAAGRRLAGFGYDGVVS